MTLFQLRSHHWWQFYQLLRGEEEVNTQKIISHPESWILILWKLNFKADFNFLPLREPTSQDWVFMIPREEGASARLSPFLVLRVHVAGPQKHKKYWNCAYVEFRKCHVFWIPSLMSHSTFTFHGFSLLFLLLFWMGSDLHANIPLTSSNATYKYYLLE